MTSCDSSQAILLCPGLCVHHSSMAAPSSLHAHDNEQILSSRVSSCRHFLSRGSGVDEITELKEATALLEECLKNEVSETEKTDKTWSDKIFHCL